MSAKKHSFKYFEKVKMRKIFICKLLDFTIKTKVEMKI